MADNDHVIIIDEEAEEQLSPEETEASERAERLKKLQHPKARPYIPVMGILVKTIIILCLVGIMLFMFLQSGTGVGVSLLLLIVFEMINYFFFK